VSWATVQPRSQPLAGAAAPAAIDINAALAAAMGQPVPTSAPAAAPVAVAAPAVASLAAAALTMPGTAAAAAAPAAAAAAVPVTDSRCVMLRNLVSLEEAQDPALRSEIMEEVEQYGKVEQLEIHQFTVSLIYTCYVVPIAVWKYSIAVWRHSVVLCSAVKHEVMSRLTTCAC
jgi:hypothetical protein